MPNAQAEGNCSGGVVRWIAPPSRRPKSLNGQHTNRQISEANNIARSQRHNPYESYSNRENEDKENRHNNPSTSTSQKQTTQIDAGLCKVLCTFVDEHLKELKRHQKLIAKARANQESNSHLIDSTVSALRVRDEQTKANTTIKQLTNYLREMTFINECCDNPANRSMVDEELAKKIAHTRDRIIDALNDFIKTNKDYDLPVAACLKINPNHQMQNQAINDSISILTSNNNSNIIEPSTIVIISEDGQQEELYTVSLQDQNEMEKQQNDAEKCRRDIMKLERDTEEMKHLFNDFYSLIKNQGDQIQSIEDNIVIATHHITEGHHSLSKTKKGLTMLVPVTGCMAGALIGGPLGLVVGGKLGGLTIGAVSSLLGLFSSFSLRRCIGLDKIKND